jgi:PAS domain S-box-containing protein
MLFNFMKNTDIFTSVSFNWNYIFFQLHIASISIISILITTVLNERNNAYNALLESENKYRTVADYTYAWEYWIDNEGNIRYMSPSVERITGYTAESFKLNPGLLDEIVFPDDREFWNNYKREILIDNCEKFKQIEFRILSKDNSIRWIGHDCRQIRSNGNSLGLRVSNRDITSLVEAERKLLVNSVEIEERERSRYSRELHDGLGPLLSTIKMYLQSLAETKDPARSKLITDESNNIVKTAIQTMREVAHGLSPFNLKNSGYVNALIDYIDGINKIQQISIDFKYNSNNRYPEFYEIILYRITTELINNTLKHANATSAGIVFSFNKSKKMISLIYNDNGKGFDTSGIKKSDKGIGLMNIMHRIKLLGGNIKIDSEAGKGMHVYIDFPLNEVVSLA